jgi:TonB family protein
MKTQFLLLSAASLLFATHAAQAAPSDLQQFAQRAYAEAGQRLDAAHLDLSGQPVEVKAYVASGGRLNGLRVSRSSGSRDTDYAVEQALKKLTVADAPPALIGSTLTLRLGATPIVQAKAR